MRSDMLDEHPDLEAYLGRLEADEYTGRVQITVDFNQGGIRRLHVAQVTNIITLHPKED